jgi:hypothetical protein
MVDPEQPVSLSQLFLIYFSDSEQMLEKIVGWIVIIKSKYDRFFPG